MTDLLSIGLTGVRAYSRALEVMGNNTANATTPGYVRRTTELSQILSGTGAPTELQRGGGNGVELSGIVRAVDMLKLNTLRRAEGQVNALQGASQWMTAIQSAVTGASSLDDPISDLSAAARALASDPANLAVRGSFLQQAAAVAERFNNISANLDHVGTDLASAAAQQATQLTGLTQGLAKVNDQLRRATEGSAGAAGLADARDTILAQMATYASIDVRLDSRGVATVRTPDAGGALLVDADGGRSVRVGPAASGGFEMHVGPKGADEAAPMIGGSIAGLSAAAQMLGETTQRLDGLAKRFTTEMNAVQMAGVDLDGNAGGALFETRTAVTSAAAANGGDARISATLAPGADPQAMALSYDGVNQAWTLARADNSASISGALPLSLDGVTVDGSGAARNGDLFRVETREGAAGIALADIGAKGVATAPRFLAEAAGGNSGGGRIQIAAGPAASPAATAPFTVTALAGGGLELHDANGTLLASGVAGGWLQGDGFSVQINGAPAEGDSFAVRPTGADSSANGNALALLDLFTARGSAGTYGEQQDALVTAISVPLSAVRSGQSIASADRDAAAVALNEASGVSLDSEAADMLRLQQAYSANARVIQTAREIFDTILSAAR